MIITSWNVNSIRVRIEYVISYLKKVKPDFLLLQEIKTEDHGFPYKSFLDIGYECKVHGQKSYNGVAIIHKNKILNHEVSLINDKSNQSRIMSIETEFNKDKYKIFCIYIPNGNPVDTVKFKYKLKWLKDFEKLIILENKKSTKIIIGGDFNIIPEDIDVYDPKAWENDALFKIEVRKIFRKIINEGFTDAFRLVNNKAEMYTFWDYQFRSFENNKGLRIDHFLISNNIAKAIKNVTIDKEFRELERPSDHAPIKLILN